MCEISCYLGFPVTFERIYAAWRILPPSSSACSCLCLCTCRPSFWWTGEKSVSVFSAYFEGLVFHFHDELLLLFLAGTCFLKLGLNVVDLHLVLHNCRTQWEVSCVRAVIKTLMCCKEEAKKVGERRWCDIIWDTTLATGTRYAA